MVNILIFLMAYLAGCLIAAIALVASQRLWYEMELWRWRRDRD